MKVLLDTNVVVPGLLSAFGPPGEIIRMAAANSLQLCFDTRIIIEYRSVLNRPKFKLDKDYVATLIDQIETYGDYVGKSMFLQYRNEKEIREDLRHKNRGHSKRSRFCKFFENLFTAQILHH